jgi:hypothetical protein
MKPGEFVRWNGRSVRALMIQCRYQDGYEAIIGPDSPDYALAVAALQSLIRPSMDPMAGRVLAMREEGWKPGFVCSPDMPNEEVPLSPLRRMRFYRDGGWDLMGMRPSGTWAPTDECGPSIVLLAFEAGRRYERERGCAYVSDKPWTRQS